MSTNAPNRRLLTGLKQMIAFNTWLNSDEGQRCINGVTAGKYLENRLLCAFNAGVEAAETEIKGSVARQRAAMRASTKAPQEK